LGQASKYFTFHSTATLSAPVIHRIPCCLPDKDVRERENRAAKGRAGGCLAMEPTDMPPPIGYICMLTDPDGNMVEFSHDQGVYALASQRAQQRG